MVGQAEYPLGPLPIRAKLGRLLSARCASYCAAPFAGIARVARNWMPSPYAACPGMVTGRSDVYKRQQQCGAAAISLGATLLYVARYAVTLPKLRSTYGLPKAISATGLPDAINASRACGSSPPSMPTVPRYAPTDANAATT